MFKKMKRRVQEGPRITLVSRAKRGLLYLDGLDFQFVDVTYANRSIPWASQGAAFGEGEATEVYHEKSKV